MSWRRTLPEQTWPQVDRLLADAAAATERRWCSWRNGEEAPLEDPPDAARARGTRHPGGGLVPDAGTEEAEHPAAHEAGGGLRLQRQLVRLADASVAVGLMQRARAAGDWEREQLLSEVSSPEVCHEWLWALDSNKGPTLSSADFVSAVRLRLGAAGPAEDTPCACCGRAFLGPAATHVFLCARAPSTRGHNAVRDVLYDVASSIDPTTEKEPTGLIPSRPALRPADVLTGVSGLSGRLAALDVGICSPAAAGAGRDCVESMRQRKVERMAPLRTRAGGERRGVQAHHLLVLWEATCRRSTVGSGAGETPGSQEGHRSTPGTTANQCTHRCRNLAPRGTHATSMSSGRRRGGGCSGDRAH